MTAELPVKHTYGTSVLSTFMNATRSVGSNARPGLRGLLLAATAALAFGCGGGGDDAASTGAGGGGGQSWSIGGTPPTQIVEGRPFSYTPTVSNPQGVALTFSAVTLPSWASLSASSGTISGTPGPGTVGTYSVSIRVTDGTYTYTSPSYSVQVVGTATGSASLSWIPPTSYTDGSPMTPASYKVYWGSSQGSYPNVVSVSGGLSSYVVDQLTPGTWYFVVTALDQAQVESVFSNAASKVVN
jgi:hypothetical protein